MSRRVFLLLSLLIALGLVAPVSVIDWPAVTGTRVEETAGAPIDRAIAASRPQRDSSRADRNRETRAHAAKGDDDQKATKKDDSGQPGAGSADGFCGDLQPMELPGSDACTHGPDPAPPGLDEDEPVQRLSAQAAEREMAAFACDGDGQSGYRVQLLYVHGSDRTSRYLQYRDSIRVWAGAADQIFRASAAETGGSRGLRFVHDATCLPLVQEVKVSPAGDGSFGATISELKNLGYNRTDRIYLAFVDTTSAGICGIGTLWSDDQITNANMNNSGPSYSRLDQGCWKGSVAAHELMHNLGGVQDSAPNSSRGGHCIDQYDVMCYSDYPYYPPMLKPMPCPANISRLDCGHNDYFSTDPTPGSYLANYWNPANNRFLMNAAALPSPPPPPALDNTTTSMGKDKKDQDKNAKGKKSKGKKSKHKKKRR